jgi:glyceraldehyde-3-phosphate dehydrogenase (NADP+)
VKREGLLIGGQWRAGARHMPVLDPWRGDCLAEVACADSADVDQAVASAARGAASMARMGTRERAAILRRAARAVEAGCADLALLLARESGKPLTGARREVARCVNTLELSAEEALRLVGETINFDSAAGGDGRSGYFMHEPLGIVVAITPFNDPLNLVAHKLGPAFAAGNAVILKPAEQAPLSALRLAAILLDAGLPPEALNVLTGHGAEFGDRLVAHPEVRMVSFTGGDRIGRHIARTAGLKKLLMELGSNSPVIVTANCDLARAAAACAAGAFSAAGQNCLGVQRIYIEDAVYAEFREALLERTAALKPGDPLAEDTDMGPMISESQARRVEAMVRDAVAAGARLLAGGGRHAALMEPTVLEQVHDDAPLTVEEIFGPVVSLFRCADLDEAIRRANAAFSMIHAAIFTRDLQQALSAARRLNAGGVMINDSTDYRLDAMPFGAARGGLGREGVKFALREMVQTKVVCFTLDVA